LGLIIYPSLFLLYLSPFLFDEQFTPLERSIRALLFELQRQSVPWHNFVVFELLKMLLRPSKTRCKKVTFKRYKTSWKFVGFLLFFTLQTSAHKFQSVHPYLPCAATSQGKSCFVHFKTIVYHFFVAPITCAHFCVARQYLPRTVLVLALIPVAHSSLYRALIFHMHFSLCIAPCQSSICPHRAQ
jgi:hypothetical protein